MSKNLQVRLDEASLTRGMGELESLLGTPRSLPELEAAVEGDGLVLGVMRACSHILSQSLGRLRDWLPL